MRSKKSFTVMLAGLLVVFGACNSEGSSTDPSTDVTQDAAPSPGSPVPQPTPQFGQGRVILQGSEGVKFLAVEVAETPEQQQLGLMHRASLGEEEGMAFIFFEESSGGFWMKNTLIPLSIAFFDAEGKILRILDMEPCEEEPCEIYDPGVAYMGALEVNLGAFERWGISEGDSLRLTHGERH
jgi:uncharacterized membrane protein (UPF0127 family)